MGCTATTTRGTPCKNSTKEEDEFCHIHKNRRECSICLSSATRNVRTLPCGHTFHVKCINRWKRTGNTTCPVCRKEFDVPIYKITLIIESRNSNERRVFRNIPNEQRVGVRAVEQFDLPENNIDYITEIGILASDSESVLEIIRDDLGIELADINIHSIL